MTALAANYRIFDLPWTPDEDESRRLRKTARTLLLVFAALGIVIPLIPMSERPPPPALPDEVVKLVLEPPPPPPPKPEAKKEEPPKPEAKPEPKPEPKPVDRQAEARKKAEKSGLLAMKDQLEDLREALEPTEMSSAPMIGRVEGPSRAERALVTSRTGVGSGGINTGSLSSGFGSGPGNSSAKVNLGPFQPIEAIRLLLALFLAGYFARRWELLREVRRKTIGSRHAARAGHAQHETAYCKRTLEARDLHFGEHRPAHPAVVRCDRYPQLVSTRPKRE